MQNFSVNRLRSYSAAAPRKVPFPIRTTLTTVLHYRTDCDIRLHFLIDRHDLYAKTPVSGQGWAFWGLNNIRLHLGVKSPQKTSTKWARTGTSQPYRSLMKIFWRQISQTDSMQGILLKKCKSRSKWIEKRSRDLLLEFWDPSVSRKPLNLEISNLASV